MNTTQRTEQITIYATSRKDAITLATSLMNFRGAQIDVERVAPGIWTAYIYSHSYFAI